MSFGTTNGHRPATATATAGDGRSPTTRRSGRWCPAPGRSASRSTAAGRGRGGQTILQACRVLGIEIPTLCYEPKLAPYGACRICAVEVEGRDDTPISCGTTIEEGMVITTHSDRVIENRRMVLELIFSDHDAYCLPPCQFKCPTRVDIPGYLKQNTLGNWEEATRILKRSLPFPAILGRVCPRRARRIAGARRSTPRSPSATRIATAPIACSRSTPRRRSRGRRSPPTGRRVAIIGAGPAA